MKSVILYGVRHLRLRRDVERFLDDDYRVIGFSDGHYTFDVLEKRTFYPLSAIKNVDFDYIFLLSNSENTMARMRAELIFNGVPSEKIINNTIFSNLDAVVMHGNLIERIGHYQGEANLVFGLSYSYGLVPALGDDFFNCSRGSLDLYYNYAVFKYMKREKMLDDVKRALLVFPYYYLNFDASRTAFALKDGMTYSIWQLNDLHHFPELVGAEDFIVNNQMFFSKLNAAYPPGMGPPHPYQPFYSSNIYKGDNYSADASSVFCKKHPDTIAENKALLLDFVRELNSANIEAHLIVPPFFLRGYTQAGIDIMNESKQELYAACSELRDKGCRIEVHDFFEQYPDKRTYFTDPMHLNDDGQQALSKLVYEAITGAREPSGHTSEKSVQPTG